MSTNIKISCDKATQICNKSQYGEATILEKIKLNIHTFLCNRCKTYSKQNSLITKLLGKYLKPCDGSNHLSLQEKQELETKLKERLKT